MTDEVSWSLLYRINLRSQFTEGDMPPYKVNLQFSFLVFASSSQAKGLRPL